MKLSELLSQPILEFDMSAPEPVNSSKTPIPQNAMSVFNQLGKDNNGMIFICTDGYATDNNQTGKQLLSAINSFVEVDAAALEVDRMLLIDTITPAVIGAMVGESGQYFWSVDGATASINQVVQAVDPKFKNLITAFYNDARGIKYQSDEYYQLVNKYAKMPVGGKEQDNNDATDNDNFSPPEPNSHSGREYESPSWY